MTPSAPTAAAASDSGRHEITPAGGVAGIDDHRQLGHLLEDRDRAIRSSVNAIGGLERADPALAQDHALVALLEDVLGGHQQLADVLDEPALEQHRAAAAADLGEQRVVLHVARTDLDHVGDLEHRSRSRTSISSVTIGRPV